METKTLTNDEIVDIIARDPDLWNHAVMEGCDICEDSDECDTWYLRLSMDEGGELLAAVVASEVESEDDLDAAITWEAKKIIRVAMAAAELGRKGGRAKSERKTAAVRANAKKARRHIPAAVKTMLFDRGAEKVRFIPARCGDDAVEAYGVMPNTNTTGWYFAGYLCELVQEAEMD